MVNQILVGKFFLCFILPFLFYNFLISQCFQFCFRFRKKNRNAICKSILKCFHSLLDLPYPTYAHVPLEKQKMWLRSFAVRCLFVIFNLTRPLVNMLIVFVNCSKIGIGTLLSPVRYGQPLICRLKLSTRAT